jgi:hypothetical protein
MKTNFKKSATLSTSIPHGSIQMVPEFKRWYNNIDIQYFPFYKDTPSAVKK